MGSAVALPAAQAAFVPGPYSTTVTTAGDGNATDNGSIDQASIPGGTVGGDFIVRCGYVRSPTAPMQAKLVKADPILAPNVTSSHTHMFFGNVTTTTSPNDNDDSTPMERTSPGGALTTTTCEESHDTASYWFPQLLKLDATNTAQPLIVNGVGIRTSTNIRAYYVNAIPNRESGRTLQNVPNGLMMVSGFPAGSLTTPPPSASSTQQVFWDCGASDNVSTPISLWPYRCAASYPNPDPMAAPFVPDGTVGHVLFPYCHDPSKTFGGVNGNNTGTGSGPNGQPFWASTAVRAAAAGSYGPDNLQFPDSTGFCPAAMVYIPRISLRLHTIDTDPCGGATPCCPSGTTACAGTPANVRYRFATENNGLGSFYSLHADYWNTWQQGPPTPPMGAAGTGTLNSLTQNCLRVTRTPVCSFVSDSFRP